MLDINSTTPIKSVSIADHEIHFAVNAKGKPTARHYRRLLSGKAKGELKNLEGYYFETEAKRLEWTNKLVALIAKRESETIARELLKKEATKNMENPYKVGDIFYDSWGYEQTNIDFYQVVEVTPKSIKLREIAGDLFETNRGDSGRTKPLADQFVSEEILVKSVQIKVWADKVVYYVKGKYSSLNVYDAGDKGVYCSWGY